jgi:3',5'-cyclic AMP phosphodiesterase CpdA
VAGNHDVPLFELHERFVDPYRRFRREISEELQPRLMTEGLVALGLNTPRGSTRKSGRLNRSQMATLERTLASAPRDALRVLVTHHPFVPPPGRPKASVVGRAPLAIAAMERAGVDLVLSGHRHVGHAHVLPVGPASSEASVLVVLAGTACSVRHRGERNSYNVVEGDRHRLAITVREWDGRRFEPGPTRRFERSGRVWIEQIGATAGGPAHDVNG